MSRLFNWRQKAALFQLAGGRCEQCGTPLEGGWHADHKTPYSAGGATDVTNGQALCPTCNLKKGAASMATLPPWTLNLRRWQQEARLRFITSNNPNFMTVATPGAGKTRLALSLAHGLLASRQVSYLVIVVPTAHLKLQWSKAATAAGIHLDPKWSNQLNGMIGGDYHGVVVTYQQVAANPEVLRAFCERCTTFAVFDEIHHAGDEKSWGTALQHAFMFAQRRLLLSGTPFRSDGNAIPFVTYEDGSSKADYPYGYADALGDEPQVCRYVWFPSFEGRMDWISGGDFFSATFADALEEQRQSERLRAAIDPQSDWMKTIIIEADRKLHEMRVDGHSSAAGLVIARDQWHARDIQKLIKHLTGHTAIIAISDDPEASDRIKAFTEGKDDRWLVAVKMVSEGVDIPRLRVGIYATNVVTELFFRQAVGRFVRWDDRITGAQDAYIYIPADPRLIAFASQIMVERDHQTAEVIKKLEREIEERAKAGDDTRGMFVPIGVTDVHADVVINGDTVLTIEHLDFARQVMSQSGVQIPVEQAAKMLFVAGAFNNGGNGTRPPVTTAPTGGDNRPLHEILKAIKKQVHGRVAQLHMATDEMVSYGEIWNKLTKSDGMEHNSATMDQHMERLRLLERWINEVKRGR